MVRGYIADISNLPDPKEYPDSLSGLSEDRVKKTLRYRQEKDRKQSLGAGLLLKRCLNEYQVNIEDIRCGKHGKPEIEGLYFNLSHSYDKVVCVISEMPVGCDIEKIKDVKDSIAERFFTENEIQYLNQFQGDRKRDEFYRLWTMKESYMKMTGEGMSLGLDRFEFVFSKDKVSVIRDGKMLSCSVKEYEVPGYKLTVCAEDTLFTEKIDTVTLFTL